jgi:hypothetical protein
MIRLNSGNLRSGQDRNATKRNVLGLQPDDQFHARYGGYSVIEGRPGHGTSTKPQRPRRPAEPSLRCPLQKSGVFGRRVQLLEDREAELVIGTSLAQHPAFLGVAQERAHPPGQRASQGEQ